MFQLKDTVHVFFQYNPRALAWGESAQYSRELAPCVNGSVWLYDMLLAAAASAEPNLQAWCSCFS